MQKMNLAMRTRRLVAATAIGGLVVLGGAGVASAQDQHSGGTPPPSDGVDPGGANVGGVTVSRGSGGLPVTGSDVIGLTVVGAGAVGIGAAAVAASRRRSARTA